MRLRLDRYLLSEIVGPLGLGLLVYTIILLMQTFFRMAEMIIRQGLPVRTVMELLAYSLPNILVLTLPMSLLLAVLLGIGRLASDSELVALRATGVSLYRILRPVLLFAFALAALNAYLMLELLPRGNTAQRRLALDIATRTVGSQFEPRVFYNEFRQKVLYIFATDPTGGNWRGVFLADSVTGPERPTSVIFADRGELEISADGGRVTARLENAIEHGYDLTRPERYETRRYDQLRLLLRERFGSGERPQIQDSKDVRSMTWSEARAAAVDPAYPPTFRAEARVQMHKMWSIPAACVVFALLGLPLAFNNRRGGKSSGFALSIGIVMLYYLMVTQTESAAIQGRMPPAVAMWLPNLVLAAAGLVLLVARNRDRSLMPAWLVRSRALSEVGIWTRALLTAALTRIGIRRRTTLDAPTGPSRRGAAAPRIVVRLHRFRLRFPNLIDRYVVRMFGFIFLLVLTSFVSLLVITDFSEAIDDMMKAKPPLQTVVRYYKYQSLQLAYEISPIAVLVSTLVTFSLLARNNEVTACRALGVSLYRLALPAFAGAVMVAALFAALQARVLPASNQKVAESRAIMRGLPSYRVARSADRQWQMGAGRFMYNFLHFDPATESIQRLQVFEFDNESKLVARLYAEEARYTDGGWVLARGWTRSFEGREQLDYRHFPGEIGVDLPESPQFFADEQRRPPQMNYGELRQYVEELRESGHPQPRYEVALHAKIGFPVGSIVMALVGFPFAFRMQRRGALYGLGVGIVLGLSFVLVYAFFRTLGEVGVLPPAVAVWSPSALFSLLAGYLFLGVRS